MNLTWPQVTFAAGTNLNFQVQDHSGDSAQSNPVVVGPSCTLFITLVPITPTHKLRCAYLGRLVYSGHQLPYQLLFSPELHYIDHVSTALRTRIENTLKWIMLIRVLKKEKLNVGAIAGGVIGGVVVLGIGIAARYLRCRKMGEQPRFVIDDENLQSETGPDSRLLPASAPPRDTTESRLQSQTGPDSRLLPASAPPRDTTESRLQSQTGPDPRLLPASAPPRDTTESRPWEAQPDRTTTLGPVTYATDPKNPVVLRWHPQQFSSGGNNQTAGSSRDQNLEDRVRILEAHINSQTAPVPSSEGPPSYEAAGGPASE
ncbi:hypothetical protein MSAN_02297000 [Mycena sanguinolenta]|uniref:Uncharacterized protein n=1 Tax=Mycena sanguinolenta TaxID=230812 RepID=A0A8H7CGF6_9AGAR|nr:hypothetical protein MSAN_02297000 [Mycena sanguinolenta]